LTSFALLGVTSSSWMGENSAPSTESARKKVGRAFANSFATVKGGNRLNRLPLRSSSSNLLARSLLWKAKASRGDSAGGTSPVRGGAASPSGVVKTCCARGVEWSAKGKSAKVSRSAMAALWVEDTVGRRPVAM
jgi:hypothetical protein